MSSFENEADRTRHAIYYLPTVRNKRLQRYDQCQELFGQPVKSDTRTKRTIRKIITGNGVDYTTEGLLDYLKENYEVIAIDQNKQQTLNIDPKSIKKIIFTGNLNRNQGSACSLLLIKSKKLSSISRKEL